MVTREIQEKLETTLGGKWVVSMMDNVNIINGLAFSVDEIVPADENKCRQCLEEHGMDPSEYKDRLSWEASKCIVEDII